MIRIKISHMNQGEVVNPSGFLGVDVILGMIYYKSILLVINELTNF